jgi:predicted metalloprotease with PDZ domain
MRIGRFLGIAAAVALAISGADDAPAEAAPPAGGPIALDVDATDVTRGYLHAHLTIPARPGELTLAYPKWVPGEHAPTAPLVNIVGFRVKALGQELAWKRDAERIHEVRVVVPAGASAIDVDLDLIDTPNPTSFTGASTSARVLRLEWNRLIVYPKGSRISEATIAPRLTLTKGWSYATALTTASERDGAIAFAPVSLETLVDSPVVAGAYGKTYDLGTVRGAPHALAVFGDSPNAVVALPDTVGHWKRLVAEENALFGARHYDGYKFLVTASESQSRYGVEHHASSEEHIGERALRDADGLRVDGDLFAHELTHSWNGKYRRPKGLAPVDFQQPLDGELLWVYEGLTQYLGVVLAARSGSWSLDDTKEAIAATAYGMQTTPGRAWRPLVDTATATQILYAPPSAGGSLRRGSDYYDEGMMIWLEADVLIRDKTKGARSLDDFCKAFFGGADGKAEVRTYDLADVVRTLATIAPNDWKAFFDARVYKVARDAPIAGIEGAGYKLGFVEKKSELLGLREKQFKFTTYWASLGFFLNGEGAISEVLAGSDAAKNGLRAGMKILAVNGRKSSPDVMKDALARAKGTSAPIELLVEDRDFVRSLKIDGHFGERYPALERVSAKPDVLEKILAPLIPPPPKK